MDKAGKGSRTIRIERAGEKRWAKEIGWGQAADGQRQSHEDV